MYRSISAVRVGATLEKSSVRSLNASTREAFKLTNESSGGRVSSVKSAVDNVKIVVDASRRTSVQSATSSNLKPSARGNSELAGGERSNRISFIPTVSSPSAPDRPTDDLLSPGSVNPNSNAEKPISSRSPKSTSKIHDGSKGKPAPGKSSSLSSASRIKIDFTAPLTPAPPETVRPTRSLHPAPQIPSNAKSSGESSRQREGHNDNKVRTDISSRSNVVRLPADKEEMYLKELAEATGLSLDRVISQVVSLGALSDSVELIPPRVLEQDKGGRITNRAEINRAAASISLPLETAEIVLLEMGIQVIRDGDTTRDRIRSSPTPDTPMRAPIVVVMGHVDHGKTTLLDALRNSDIVAKEQGGITQSIAAFRVDWPHLKLEACFLDTPGHEAFASMRKSGTAVTDVACVVVAATDGVMPQTIESVNFARSANLPIVFAITKTDMALQRGNTTEEALETRVVDQLRVEGLFDDDRDVVVRVVAPQKKGLDQLMEAIKLQVEVNESLLLARCKADDPGEAVVIESRTDRALGHVADIVVRWGTIKVGDVIVCDDMWGKVRRLERSDGSSVQSCLPATPIRICGLEENLPPGSDVLVVAGGEKEAKRIVEYRKAKRLKSAERDLKLRLIKEARESAASKKSKRAQGDADVVSTRKTVMEKKMQRKIQQEKMEELFDEMEERRTKQVRVILKADSEGSLSALNFAVRQMKERGELPENFDLVVVRSSVGQFTEQDLELARTTDSYLLGFNIKMPGALMKRAKQLSIPGDGFIVHPVIYNVLEEFAMKVEASSDEHSEEQRRMDALRRPKAVANVLNVFDLKGKDKKQVAGLRVTEGTINKNDVFLVKRNGQAVITDFKHVDSLKILKDSVASVEKGTECGLALAGFVGFQVGDVIEAYDAKVLTVGSSPSTEPTPVAAQAARA